MRRSRHRAPRGESHTMLLIVAAGLALIVGIGICAGLIPLPGA